MAKVSLGITNDYCPQTLFLYGTYKEDGQPNFGLFCWFSYVFNDDLGVMACIGGEKLTKDLIRKNKVFSANLVTTPMASLADYYGHKPGYELDKMDILPKFQNGEVLDVPILEDSPVSFELEVSHEIQLSGSDVFICKIRNVLADSRLANKEVRVEDHIKRILPLTTVCQTYFNGLGDYLGNWGKLPNNKL